MDNEWRTRHWATRCRNSRLFLLRVVCRATAMLLVTGSVLAGAGIVTDGSTGALPRTIAGVNAGPGTFTIQQSDGRTAGSNLFHSFRTFNLDAGQTANFVSSNPAIRNVISRVTGGQSSQIHGRLQLTAAGGSLPAFYFLNPAGVIFGQGASVDVPGAFHVSTADALKFANGDAFSAGTASPGSTFSSAPPVAFGFLRGAGGRIAIADGARVATSAAWQSIAIVGRELEIKNASVFTQGGEMRVVAVGSPAAEVALGGPLPGAHGRLEMINGTISSTAGAAQSPRMAGGGIFASPGAAHGAGDLAVAAGTVTMQGGGIWADAAPGSSGAGGTVSVAADDLILQSGAFISSSSSSVGDAGRVRVRATNLRIDGSGGGEHPTGIFSDTFADASAAPGSFAPSRANAGTVDVSVAGDLTIRSGAISSNTRTAGRGGNVEVEANAIAIASQGVIGSWSFAAGDAGMARVRAGDLRIIGDGGAAGSNSPDNAAGKTGILAEAVGPGNAGVIDVAVERSLAVSRGALISSNTYAAGAAGLLTVRADRLLIDSGAAIAAQALPGSSGQTGSVVVIAKEITLANDGKITIANGATLANAAAITPTSITVSAPRINILYSADAITTKATGNVAAGSIRIAASERLFLDPSGITTTAENGNGGSIDIRAGLLWLQDSQIATSVKGTAGNGGDIRIAADSLILHTGFIQANTAAADAGGGMVWISTRNLIAGGNSLLIGGDTPYVFRPGAFGYNVIQAAAPGGVSGMVQLSTPVLDISGGLLGLDARLLRKQEVVRRLCASSAGSSLVAIGRGGLPRAAAEFLSPSEVFGIDLVASQVAVASRFRARVPVRHHRC